MYCIKYSTHPKTTHITHNLLTSKKRHMHTYYTNPNDDDFCQILREERNKGETHQQRTFVFT
jgi:hypothetical protein